MKNKKSADSKIDFSFENIHFSCEGDNDWVEKQLNNMLNRIPSLLSVHKMNENLVEDVIDVKEEDVNEVSENIPKTPKFRAGKSLRDAIRVKKPKTDKKIKIKSVKEKVVKEKAAKAPKTVVTVEPIEVAPPKIKVAKIPRATKEPKAPKTAKVPKVKAAKVAKEKTIIDSALSQFIEEKKVTNNQVRKFLATAVFLAKSNDIKKLSTPMISKALKSNGIEKLQNASDCLNKNEKKGYCIKDGKEFIITENGYLSIE